eukprot:CAMPEP_0116066744 /NCGR_PEP_ID=MMETSP0322-20121206/10575_1 /TAXON_ID=163516 /ORGANISM="Leptocylindrus danicus var. apora, Strain B651" /LENGTH=417 /DNA_ID=CAMNT_0003553377 /DNA_START=139 /DNA_END=1392 /DNA_ORIENTATION=+
MRSSETEYDKMEDDKPAYEETPMTTVDKSSSDDNHNPSSLNGQQQQQQIYGGSSHAFNAHTLNSLTIGVNADKSSVRHNYYAAITIFLYMAVGVLFYSVILDEGWEFVDSLYFSMTTFTTVGYGDLTPESQGSRLFTAFYALLGVALIGSIVSYFGEKLADESVNVAKESLEKANEKRIATLLEKEKQKSMIEGRSSEIEREPPAAKEEEKKDSTVDLHSDQALTTKDFLWENWIFLPLLAIFFIGSYIEIKHDQGLTFIDVLYYTVVTLTTIGYGDIAPDGRFSRGLSIIFVPLSTFSMATLISRFAAFQVRRREILKQAAALEKGFDKEQLKAMDRNGDGQVHKNEFVYFMLISSEKTTMEYIKRMEDLFDQLDKDNSGYLDEADLLYKIERSNKKLGETKVETTTQFVRDADLV